MKESFAHYRIHAQPGFNGTVYGIEFTGGQAYINTREMGEKEARVALDRLGHDPRFVIEELTENRTYEGVRDPIIERRPVEEPDPPKKPARK